MESLLKTANKEATKRLLSSLYRAAEDIFKQAVNRGVVDNTINSRLHRFKESKKSAQSNVRCLMKTPIFTAPITKLVIRHIEIAFMNEAKFYRPNTNVGNKNDETTPPSPLTGRSLASSTSSKHDENKKSEKKKKASYSSRSSYMKCGCSNCSSEDYKVDRYNKGAKAAICYDR